MFSSDFYAKQFEGGFEVIYAIVEENNQAKLNKLENIKRTNLGFK
jgi:hypothetical protein